MAEIMSDELNFLVLRYLQESGLLHTAFSLNYEAGIDTSSIDGHTIPPGALVNVVQKGLQYIEMEANSRNTDVDTDEDNYIITKPWDLLTKDINELQSMVNEERKNLKEKLVIDKVNKKQQEEREEMEVVRVSGKGSESSKDNEISRGKRPKTHALY